MDTWWIDSPQQRYWIEANSRPDIGDELFAPVRGRNGRSVWHYDLVQYVRPGDIVLHWKSGRGIVATSVALGPLSIGRRSWSPRTDSDAAFEQDCYVMPLAEAEELPSPVSLDDIRTRMEAVLMVRDVLSKVLGRDVSYFPFSANKRSGLQLHLSYLKPFPVELFEVLESVGLELPTPFDPITGSATTRDRRPGVGGGYLQDAVLRMAIERHAVAEASSWYASRGATNIIELGKPYDLDLQLRAVPRRVEVKGSARQSIDKVLLTRNEVAHARAYPHTDLVVVDGIAIEQLEDRQFRCSGGELRRWENWSPDGADLSPLQFEYRLPSAA